MDMIEKELAEQRELIQNDLVGVAEEILNVCKVITDRIKVLENKLKLITPN